MSNILIALATLIIGFFLASYGAYTGYYSLARTQAVTKVQASLERQLVYIDATKEDLGRVPNPTDLVARRITGENRFGYSFQYLMSGGVGVLCVTSQAEDYVVEAFRVVAEQRPGSLYGSTCNTSGGPSASSVSVSVRIS